MLNLSYNLYSAEPSNQTFTFNIKLCHLTVFRNIGIQRLLSFSGNLKHRNSSDSKSEKISGFRERKPDTKALHE